MNDRKNGLLLSGFLFLCVWLILFLVAVTETGGVKYNFAFAATLAALCGVVCMVCYFTLDVMERRKDASGIYNFEYYRLKRKTKKELEQARDAHFSNLAYLYDVEEIEYNFTRDAKILGVDLLTIQEDFSDMLATIEGG